MNRITLILPLLVAVCGAAPQPASDNNVFVMREMRVKPVDGAPSLPTSRIYNGKIASPGQFPYQAMIIADKQSFCGGSLISNRTVLTAAHCVDGVQDFVVYLGITNSYTPEKEGLVIKTRSKVKHRKYSDKTLNNDIGLIKLGQEITFTQNIKPINLTSDSSPYVGVTARVSGWGMTSDHSNVSKELRYADLEVISNEQCIRTYGSKVVVSSVLCANGANNQSACGGDSGGPLVFNNTQIGIVSFGADTSCEQGYPSGFTRVSSFSKWIAENTAPKASRNLHMIAVACLALLIGRQSLATM